MNEMRNYNVYIKGMEMGFQEKLFFLDHVELDDYDTIIDFGCGAGDVLRAVADTYGIVERLVLPPVRFIGIDKDDYMRDLTKSKTPEAEVYPELTRDMLNERTLIIFNSVLHEVEDYWQTLRKIIKGTGATVAIRDMRYVQNTEMTNQQTHSQQLAALVRHSNPELLADFIERYGMSFDRQIYHYLLKYTYVDNWRLELQEDYFSFNYYDLFALGTRLYERCYTLDYKKESVMKDFGIEMTDFTHTQIIMRLDREAD